MRRHALHAFVAAVAVSWLVGCTSSAQTRKLSGRDVRQIQPGMTEGEVQARLGLPAFVQHEPLGQLLTLTWRYHDAGVHPYFEDIYVMIDTDTHRVARIDFYNWEGV